MIGIAPETTAQERPWFPNEPGVNLPVSFASLSPGAFQFAYNVYPEEEYVAQVNSIDKVKDSQRVRLTQAYLRSESL
jgi:hypothetical protein